MTEAIAAYRTIVDDFGPERETLASLAALYELTDRWPELAETLEAELGLATTPADRLAILSRIGEVRRTRLERPRRSARSVPPGARHRAVARAHTRRARGAARNEHGPPRRCDDPAAALRGRGRARSTPARPRHRGRAQRVERGEARPVRTGVERRRGPAGRPRQGVRVRCARPSRRRRRRGVRRLAGADRASRGEDRALPRARRAALRGRPGRRGRGPAAGRHAPRREPGA